MLIFFFLSMLIFIPGSARAEGVSSSGSELETSSTIFKYEEVEGGISITGFKENCSVETLEIPSEIDGKPVVAIGEQAFQCNTNIKSASIPSSVTKIGYGAFASCFFLESITFRLIPFGGNDINGYDLECLGNNQCLTAIYVPKGAEEAYKQHFPNPGLIQLIQGKDIVSEYVKYVLNETKDGLVCEGFIGYDDGCSEDEMKEIDKITDLVIPAKVDGLPVKSIADEAFVECVFASISIPASVTSIGDKSFDIIDNIYFGLLPWKGNDIWGMKGQDLEGYSDSCFSYPDFLGNIYVPAGCEDDFKASMPSVADKIQGKDLVSDGLKYALSDAKDGLACTGLVDDPSQPARIELPAKAIGYPVTQIAADAFQENTSLEYILVKEEATYDQLMSHAFAASDKLVMQPKEALSLSDESGLAAASRPTLYQAGNISYERTLDDQDQYATLCLPFALDLGKTDGVFDKVYVPMNTLIHNTAKSTPELEHFVLMLEEQESDAIVPAGQPVFVKLSEGTTQIALANQADELLNATLQPKTEAMKVVDWDGASGLMAQNKQFSISYGSLFQPKAQVSEDDHIWSFNANGSFGPQRQGAMPPFRLFLTVEENAPTVQAKAYSISIGVSDDSTTGIREIISSDGAIATNKPNASSAYAGIIYDLGGRKVATASEAKHLSKGIYIQNGKKMVVK